MAITTTTCRKKQTFTNAKIKRVNEEYIRAEIYFILRWVHRLIKMQKATMYERRRVKGQRVGIQIGLRRDNTFLTAFFIEVYKGLLMGHDHSSDPSYCDPTILI